MKTQNLLKFVARFAIVHLLVHSVFAFVFVAIQNSLPEANRVALDLYEPYRSVGLVSYLGQLLRGIAFALVFFPFYTILFERNIGKIVLFSSMFGIALIGSVEPQPGSIEGIIYTLISFSEHAFVITTVALQMLVFVWLVFKVERKFSTQALRKEGKLVSFKATKGYLTRFVVVHLVTYWVVGSIFYQVAGYADALDSMEIFELWRPLENLPAVLLVFFGQIFRGAFLGILLYPFYELYIQKRNGWLLLFLLFIGLTALGSPIFLTEFIVFEGTFIEFLKELIIGIPEIVSQMLIFSVLFFLWQRKAYKKNISKETI